MRALFPFSLFAFLQEESLHSSYCCILLLQNWEVLNTAVLTGRQVSQAMKVFIVSQAGKAADVTFQASCHSEDDSVLKVRELCAPQVPPLKLNCSATQELGSTEHFCKLQLKKLK